MTTKVRSSVLENTAVTAGTYGSTTTHSTFTVDAQGRLTSASSVTPSIASSQITGVITSGQIASTAVTAGTYGSTTKHSTFTVDAKGRLTSASSVTPSIATTQLTGTISNSQIAAVANTKITGVITDSQIAAVANTKITGVITAGQIASTAVTAGTYGSTTKHSTFTVDAKGRLTAASSVTPSIASSQITGTTGSGNVVLATSATLVSPTLGTPTSGTLTNCTGLPYSGLTGTVPTWNQSTTGNATTATTATTATILNGTWNQMPAGTRMPFAQAAAPTGWTQDTSSNADNRMLRVVKTAGGGVDGSASPILNNVVSSHTHTFTGNALGNHTHTDSGHAHTLIGGVYAGNGSVIAGYGGGAGSFLTSSTNTGTANISSVSAGTPAGTNAANASASDWAPRYIDMIICSKN